MHLASSNTCTHAGTLSTTLQRGPRQRRQLLAKMPTFCFISSGDRNVDCFIVNAVQRSGEENWASVRSQEKP